MLQHLIVDSRWSTFGDQSQARIQYTGGYVTTWHGLANRHSCSTSAETRDRKCCNIQFILVVGKMDMINQICQML